MSSIRSEVFNDFSTKKSIKIESDGSGVITVTKSGIPFLSQDKSRTIDKYNGSVFEYKNGELFIDGSQIKPFSTSTDENLDNACLIKNGNSNSLFICSAGGPGNATVVNTFFSGKSKTTDSANQIIANPEFCKK